jgi:D-alanyl-lipoteichoic acid acyltransferase DltB (MBOAT superfamily)
MGWEKPENNFFHYLLYITFFPKFLSGPIERSNHFLPQLKEKKAFNGPLIITGLRIVLIGFFKKVAIANQMAPYVFDAFKDVSSAAPLSLWVLFILLPLYLYFDFSGYTDIAIGIARIFGIDLLPNFNRPFLAQNVTTFWKRFHISLASWFNDYIFRQTVFNRRKWGIFASVYAVFITWILFGIWHGAGWNFMLLGLLQALAMNYEFFTRKVRYRLFSKLPGFVNIWTGRIVTYLFYCLSLVFFFSHDLKSVGIYLSRLTEIRGPIVVDDMSTKPFSLLIYIPVFLMFELMQNDYGNLYRKLEAFWLGESNKNRFFRWTLYSIMITILFVAGFKGQQFVYANF